MRWSLERKVTNVHTVRISRDTQTRLNRKQKRKSPEIVVSTSVTSGAASCNFFFNLDLYPRVIRGYRTQSITLLYDLY